MFLMRTKKPRKIQRNKSARNSAKAKAKNRARRNRVYGR